MMYKKEMLLGLKIVFTLFIIIQFSCDNDNSNSQSPSQPRRVKYEITGNYTGHFTIVYTNNLTGNTTVNVTSLPWSKIIDYPITVTSIGIGGNSVVSMPGLSGQNATLKIYSEDNLVRTSNLLTANSNGLISLPTLTFTF